MDQRELSLVQCRIHNTGGSAGQGKRMAAQRGSDCCSPLKELLSMAGCMLHYVALSLTVYFCLVLGCYGIKHGLNVTQKYDFSSTAGSCLCLRTKIYYQPLFLCWITHILGGKQ